MKYSEKLKRYLIKESIIDFHCLDKNLRRVHVHSIIENEELSKEVYNIIINSYPVNLDELDY